MTSKHTSQLGIAHGGIAEMVGSLDAPEVPNLSDTWHKTPSK